MSLIGNAASGAFSSCKQTTSGPSRSNHSSSAGNRERMPLIYGLGESSDRGLTKALDSGGPCPTKNLRKPKRGNWPFITTYCGVQILQIHHIVVYYSSTLLLKVAILRISTG